MWRLCHPDRCPATAAYHSHMFLHQRGARLHDRTVYCFRHIIRSHSRRVPQGDVEVGDKCDRFDAFGFSRGSMEASPEGDLRPCATSLPHIIQHYTFDDGQVLIFLDVRG
jgi:hypothetical protein